MGTETPRVGDHQQSASQTADVNVGEGSNGTGGGNQNRGEQNEWAPSLSI